MHIYTKGSDAEVHKLPSLEDHLPTCEELYERYLCVPNSIKEFEIGFLETNRLRHSNDFHLMSPKQKKVYLEVRDKIEKNHDG